MKRALTFVALIAAMSLAFTACKKKDEEKKGDTKEAMDDSMEAMDGDMDAMDMDAMDDMGDMGEAMDMAEAMDMDAMDDMGEAMGDAMDAAAGDTGVAECDAFLKQYKCVVSKMPAGKEAAEQAMKTMTDAWKQAAANPQAKAALADTCKKAAEAQKQAWAAAPYAKDCL
jgi:hypothetical protein